MYFESKLKHITINKHIRQTSEAPEFALHHNNMVQVIMNYLEQHNRKRSTSRSIAADGLGRKES